MVLFGFSWFVFSAWFIMLSAMRSFILPPGLRDLFLLSYVFFPL